MALAHLNVFSKTLRKQVALNVILPEGRGAGPFPVFYLLHGLSDDYTQWLRRTRIEMYVSGRPLIVVMPDGFRGFYMDNEAGPKYGTYLGEDIVEIVEAYFPAIPKRSARAIGGLSMGGYGALRTALAYPDKFVSANSHSGALMAGTHRWDTPKDRPDAKEFQSIFGKRPAGSRHDLLALAAGIPRKKLPALHIDCGTEDFLIQDNRTFHAEMTKLKIPHAYEEHPGAHDWDYWDLHIRSALAFHGKHLGIG